MQPKLWKKLFNINTYMQKNIKNKIKCVPCIHVLKNQDNTRFKGKYNPQKKNIYF